MREIERERGSNFHLLEVSFSKGYQVLYDMNKDSTIDVCMKKQGHGTKEFKLQG
jgi:hypothetical protein